jgi:F-type H+-transporting ATPase subunit alpha
MSVAQEVVSILIGSSGALDDIDVKQVSHFLDEFLLWLRLEAPEYLDQIDKTGQLNDEFLTALNEAVAAYKTMYKFSFGA